MTKDEALRLALEAITQYLAENPDPSEEAVEGLCDARAMLRKALAEQPASMQEGKWVGTVVDSGKGYKVIGFSVDGLTDIPVGTRCYTSPPPPNYAAELRRLHEANQAMLEALKEIVEQHGQWNNGIWASSIARAAIAKGEQA